jgi:hypothetical protein
MLRYLAPGGAQWPARQQALVSPAVTTPVRAVTRDPVRCGRSEDPPPWPLEGQGHVLADHVTAVAERAGHDGGRVRGVVGDHAIGVASLPRLVGVNQYGLDGGPRLPHDCLTSDSPS